MRTATIVVTLALLVAACATPEVAERYESKSYIPAEVAAALGSEDPTARADAAKQIEAMEPGTRREALLELSRDERAPVRLMAVSQLGKHHAAEAGASERLAEVLSLDPDEDVRVATVSGLAEAGPEGLRALAGALMDDGSLGVKRAAASALDRATGQKFGAPLVGALDEADDAADEAAMAYEDWLDAHPGGVR